MTKGEIIRLEIADRLVHDVCIIIEQAQKSAYLAINETLVKRNWLLGMRIQHEVLIDQQAEYGEQIIKSLAKDLTEHYGRGFSMRNLYYYVNFYQEHPSFFQLTIGHFPTVTNENILQAATTKSPVRLSWTHYSIIQQELTHEGRTWYENEAANEMWSTRTLQRNASSQYYHRLLRSQNKAYGS